MNKELIDFYEEEQRKIQKEINDLWEVGKKSPKRKNRLVEIEYILEGLTADETIVSLRKENLALWRRLQKEGIDLGE